ncbi:MAG: alpha/beta hydrolase [Acidimicrobiales bacterium]|jgi:pimeloyl-ACP methyl ester carboxylesterase|nr:alpha/beta hydrolase [Acidimicrobiales bacterium]MDP6900566.1 alpha/beta hydrolase [Acidimicrobiales bacterium]HJL98959.1 alpha/beta hydrolase [Acidimicrobiales bacterium]
MREPHSHFVSSEDQVQVAVHDYGGAGHPTLFVHGTGLVSRMWEPIINRLGSDFRAICVDLRAHGATTSPSDINFFDHRMVADLTSVVDAFDLQDAWVVGHSMGGATSILTSLERPGAFERAWVYEPILFERTEDRPAGSINFVEATKRRRSIFPSREEVINRYSTRPPLNEVHQDCLEAYVRHGFVDRSDGSIELACDPLLESRAFEQFLQQGWDRLSQVAIDVLVAYGGAGQDRPSTAAASIAERLPSGSLEVFTGSNHFGCFASLERVADSLRAWFIDTPARA